MDYKDYQVARSDFWFRAKKGLLGVLMKQVARTSFVGAGRGLPLQDKRMKILNVGAGTGDDLDILARFGEVFATDIDPSVLSVIPKELTVDVRVADLCNLPYKDNTFDVVVSLDVFEHIQDDVKAVSEVYRVLKPGGAVVFSVPAFQSLWSARDVALEHKRRYSKPMLKRLFSLFHSVYLNHWNFALFIPVALQRFIMRNTEPRVESIELPALFNSLLYRLMKLDTFCVKHRIPLPFGISIVGWCRK